MTTENSPHKTISPLFVSDFTVDTASPFERHLNRLEVEIGGEDYRGLKRVELVELPDHAFEGMVELTERLLHSTQNNYNRQLLIDLRIRVYLDKASYQVYYRLPQRTIRFVPSWREGVLLRIFGKVSPITFMKKMGTAQVFAFSTSSSNATIPVTLHTVEKRLGVNKSIASFTVPFGATINM
ncbi:MAG: dicarboxylate/amino acid:cation symporter, partial [Geopsychrobacter sp.]|nr:dicarboxylate/amino acid:cation symporter [Geopsychrobacter sp.]